jgi:hypothetical protein
MRDVDIPVRRNGLTLKCKEQCPHESNAEEEPDQGATGNAEFAVGEDP